jgi:peptidoglycan/xylan/chitin deacetylase (PgdA/CDA1 family)
MKANYRRRRIAVLATALAIAATASMGAAWGSGAFDKPPKPPVTLSNSNCSGGYVTFTFDDGPGPTTQGVINELRALHMPAVFFVIGKNAAADPQLVREEAADGFVIGDHTWDHKSLTGFSTHTPALTDAQVKAELGMGISAITAAGAPRPTLWRPPYGDVSPRDGYLASTLGLRIVLDYGYTGSNIVDTWDWRGDSATQIFRNVTQGYTRSADHVVVAPVHAGSIVAAHDNADPAHVSNLLGALPQIVAWMNAHHLCATSTVRPDATGGEVPNYVNGAAPPGTLHNHE